MNDNSNHNFITFWRDALMGKDISATQWSSQDIPNQGKTHSRPDDNFRQCYPGQSALFMRVIGATLPVKGVPMVKEAIVKKF